MAEFLVLEEDGTSHIDLEETTDGFLLEESSPHERTGGGVAGATLVVPPPPPPAPTSWRVGTITVPGSTGSQAVTGLGGTPKAVFFFGTNWLTEDASVTGAGNGVFRGMASPKWDDPGTIVQNGACVVPPGDAHNVDNYAINMLSDGSGATMRYRATLTSFDGDGFSLSWTHVTGGGYKVVYVALMGDGNVGGYIGQTATLTPGWKAGAAMLHGAWGGPSLGGGDRSQEFYGSAAYPGVLSSGWMSAGLTAYTFPTAPGSGQRNIGTYEGFPPTTIVTRGGRFISSFLSVSDVLMYPTGSGLTNFVYNPQSVDNAGMVVFWDDEKNATGRLTPATSTAGTYTVTGLPFAPALLIAYSISNEPTGQVSGLPARGAIGFSVVTEAFEWSALSDGTASGRGAFQSFQRGFTDTVDGSNVHAGTIELTSDGFILTTEEDDAAPSTWVWHVFGAPTSVWIPQIYRLLVTA